MKTQIMSPTHEPVVDSSVHATPSSGEAIAPNLQVGELVEVLRDQLAAHHRLLQLEMSKREAIIARDGELLKTSAGEQAKELHRIDLLESRRDKLVGKIMPGQADAALAEIMQSESVTAPERQELGRYLSALRSALFELKKLSEVNARMLIDSRDLFKTMMLSLAGRGEGNEHKVSRPVLVDANC
jgi:hypothetical protein